MDTIENIELVHNELQEVVAYKVILNNQNTKYVPATHENTDYKKVLLWLEQNQ